jgi:hypothetical protein
MPPKWDNIHNIQDIIGKKLKNHEKWYIDCVKMVCGELLENAVKYYMKKGIKKKIDFYFSNTNGLIIGIRNQIIDQEDSNSLITEIQRINGSVSPYNLYIERLQEIMDNRIKGESKLGLLRIASDGGFKFVYSLEKDKISVFAQKNKQGEDERMKALEYEDLRIEVKEVDNIVSVSWIGKCRTLNPEHILDSYLAHLTQFVKGKKVIVSFEKLDSMNSSTVPPLLTFIKALEENSVESEFLYNDKEDWQRASFRPLSVIAGKYEYVKIKAYNFQ